MLVFWLVEVVRKPPIASESPSGHRYRPTTWCFRLVELGGFVELFGAPRRRGAPCKSRQHGPGRQFGRDPPLAAPCASRVGAGSRPELHAAAYTLLLRALASRINEASMRPCKLMHQACAAWRCPGRAWLLRWLVGGRCPPGRLSRPSFAQPMFPEDPAAGAGQLQLWSADGACCFDFRGLAGATHCASARRGWLEVAAGGNGALR